ncbi:MAG: PHP domain-containing protein [Spirochaetaceae bacterium]|nr:PHP domain-containing protein [Spirochaetaceae bacterium]MCF7938864.1 PHP domain-containing protein [Spirochaetales bacterium]
MVQAAIERGYEYLSITDHSKRVSVAHGMDEKRLAEQIEYINQLNENYSDFRIIKSIEVDVLPDGSLDLSNNILKELDLVLCSVHYNQNLSMEKQTTRVLKAMENPYFDILAHPTGRLIGSREPYEIDLQKVMGAAKERGCFLEVNAHPQRLDLDDVHARMARER